MRSALFPIAACVLLCLDCSTKKPKAGEVAEAYGDLLRHRTTASGDSAAHSRGVDSILSSHGLTREEFLRSVVRLADDPAAAAAFPDSAASRILLPR